MYNSFFKLYIPLSFIMILISLFIIIILTNSTNFISPDNQEFFWPLPGNHNITSKFGHRTSPTTGASSFHSGIDIAASENTPIYSCTSGKVIFSEFQGANRIHHNNTKQQY